MVSDGWDDLTPGLVEARGSDGWDDLTPGLVEARGSDGWDDLTPGLVLRLVVATVGTT